MHGAQSIRQALSQFQVPRFWQALSRLRYPRLHSHAFSRFQDPRPISMMQLILFYGHFVEMETRSPDLKKLEEALKGFIKEKKELIDRQDQVVIEITDH